MTLEGRLAIVEDDPLLLDQLVWTLKADFEIHPALDAEAGLALVELEPDLFLVDLSLPPSHRPDEGLLLISRIHEKRPEATVVVMTGETDRSYAQKAMALGAFDFFHKPLDRSELLVVLRRALERHRLLQENRSLKEQMVRDHSFGELVGSTEPMRELFRMIQKVAPSNATVLIQGESGTGKELVAHAIHRAGTRRNGPFVAVNGAAMQDTLAESELFGHERGAFTGAVASRPGKFELAHRGTLFLDEVATLSPSVQAKLLRALESREIERVGGRRPIAVDIRLVAASNEDLAKLVASGRFREDLFYRLNSVTLRLPPLRERKADIPILVSFFADRYAGRHGRPAKKFSASAIKQFEAFPWRGNVRELEHLIEMLTLMVDAEEITAAHLPPLFREAATATASDAIFSTAVAEFERDLLTRAIAAAGGIKARAGRQLGLDDNQMKYLCRKYGLS